MPELPESSNHNSGILISRNRPVAFVVGVAGFLGSFVAEHLLAKNIQVVGIDELDESSRANLKSAFKHRDFHFINQDPTNPINLKLPRIDYAFFLEEDYGHGSYIRKLISFLKFIKEHKETLENEKEKTSTHPRIVLASSIKLYKKNIDREFENLKEGEIKLAKFAKEFNLNARIIRFSTLYGPRMSFEEDDPIVSLIQASLADQLQEELVSEEFSTRALYIDDAAHLVLKAVLAGGTAQKIYDGVLTPPVKVSEVKQILLDPLWHETRGFKATELPVWSTPNLKKTMEELSWKPKTDLIESLKKTIAYFKDNDVKVPKIEVKPLSEEKRSLLMEDSVVAPQKFSKAEEEEVDKKRSRKVRIKNPLSKYNLVIFLGLAIIIYGLLFPIASLAIGAFNIRTNLIASKEALAKGDFDKALNETNAAKQNIKQIKQVLGSLAITKKISWVGERVDNLESILNATEEGIDGVNHGAVGMQALYKTTKIMSGEDSSDPKPLYQQAQFELSSASEKIAKVAVALSDPKLIASTPKLLSSSLVDTQAKLKSYGGLIDKAKTASYLMPQITAVSSHKVYLILLQNNMELRPTGGFIGSYGRVEFENGRIKKITVDDIYNLDGELTEHVEPPIEIKNDLGQKDWFLRDSNFDPDFPTSARQAEFFYNKEASELVNGVIAMDLSASSLLVEAVGGLNLTDYNEKITGNNLFEKAITHAEVNFFPGSQAKKNYLTNLETQLLNKIFFLNDQNWPAIVQALGDSLEQKHLLIYLSDPQIFSYVASQDWAGVLPRQPATKIEGETADFLAPVEANFGANKSNYYLERSYRLETAIGKQKEIFHHLVISYKNNSPSTVFPAGTYKNRLRIYVPAGSKLSKVTFGEEDITPSVSTFSDYGRTGFSMLVQIVPKQQKNLMIDYQLAQPLNFKDGKNSYHLDLIKQAGTEKDNFEWDLTYPIDVVLQDVGSNTSSNTQEITFSNNLLENRTFSINFKQK